MIIVASIPEFDGKTVSFITCGTHGVASDGSSFSYFKVAFTDRTSIVVKAPTAEMDYKFLRPTTP